MRYDLVIVGGGISGLTAACMAADKGIERVLILDYRKSLGGFTRPYWEQGNFHREAAVLRQAEKLPYEVRIESTVVGFFPGDPHQVCIHSPHGTSFVEATYVFIASGALEKPREAHHIPGSRPAGVMTPMMAVQLLERGYLPGNHILVMDNGRLTKSTMDLLTERGGSVAAFSLEEWDVAEISGFSRVESVRLANRVNGTLLEYFCDTLIFAKERIPSTFFLKGTPIERDRHLAIKVDELGRTNMPNVFAAGSCTSLGMDDHSNSIELAEATMTHLLEQWVRGGDRHEIV